MSLRRKLDNHFGLVTSSGGFSTKSLGSYSIPKISIPNNGVPIKPITLNTSLLTPVDIQIDPSIQAVRVEEKNQIRDLNDRFASFIDKVGKLEQQNKMLEIKWKLLRHESVRPSNIESMLKAYIAHLERQLESLSKDKKTLDTECSAMHDKVDEYRIKYEEEFNNRKDAENNFVLTKKVVDAAYMVNMDLQEKMVIISDESLFRKAVHDAELSELQENLKATSVKIEMDNSRALNMDQIISVVKAQYGEIASRNRKEAEDWYKTKRNQLNTESGQYDNELHTTKGEIAKLKRTISQKQHDLDVLMTQINNIEKDTTEVEQKGEKALLDAKQRIMDLEQALQQAKKDMALQLKQYHELMNVKLALDIEISTYEKLLEGEEARHGPECVVKVQAAPTQSAMVMNNQRQRLNPVLVKTVEIRNWTHNLSMDEF